MREKRDDSGASRIAVIAEGAQMNGKLRSKAVIRIEGMFTGEIVAENEFIVGQNGQVEAKIWARKAVIAGLFKGDIFVLDKIEITSTGQFIGNLLQKEPRLVILEGGRFKGTSSFVDDPAHFPFTLEMELPVLSESGGSVIALHDLKI